MEFAVKLITADYRCSVRRRVLHPRSSRDCRTSSRDPVLLVSFSFSGRIALPHIHPFGAVVIEVIPVGQPAPLDEGVEGRVDRATYVQPLATGTAALLATRSLANASTDTHQQIVAASALRLAVLRCCDGLLIPVH